MPWRVVVVALLVESVVFTFLGAIATYDPPFQHVHHAFGQIPKRYEVFGLLLLPPFLALLVASAVSIRVRYRSATPEVRAQLKWFVLAGATIPGTLLLGWAGVLLPVVGGVDFASVGLACIYRSADRAGDHDRDPEDHLGLVAHRVGPRAARRTLLVPTRYCIAEPSPL